MNLECNQGAFVMRLDFLGAGQWKKTVPWLGTGSCRVLYYKGIMPTELRACGHVEPFKKNQRTVCQQMTPKTPSFSGLHPKKGTRAFGPFNIGNRVNQHGKAQSPHFSLGKMQLQNIIFSQLLCSLISRCLSLSLPNDWSAQVQVRFQHWCSNFNM